MNGDASAAERKILISAPLQDAIELTRQILFRPFDFTKWLLIGFAAFLAGLVDGTRASFGFPSPGDLEGKAKSTGGFTFPEFDGALLITIISIAALVALALLALCMWAGSRGRFMFIDCIVRNRGAIAEPWREYRGEGNSLFLFLVAVALLWLAVIALLATPFLVPWLQTGEFNFGTGHLLYLLIVVALVIVVGMLWNLLMWFVPMVMYCQRCGPLGAVRQLWNLVVEYPTSFILFLLLSIALWLGAAIAGCLVTCFTCCLAAIPYVGTVILLPLYVFLCSFTLLFLRQFGPEFDAWATVTPLAQNVAAPEIDAPPPDEPPPLPPRSI